mmetsp:Transcript_30126/g.42022  ORF Transcript_30126/g.42022 Transcript_30126/m.42022 type:complete len:593 (+) Transcript_30126:163-1941(+)
MTEVKFDPLQILKEDLQDEDHSVQIEGAKKIPVVATAIGPKRARKDLIDFLSEYLNESSDETMVAIGKAMADVAKVVGGAEFLGCLVPLLEKLAFEEETVVCDAASTSLGSIIQDMGKNEVEKQIMPILERMANAEWFQPRVGVSKLLPMAYPKASEGSQKTIIEWFGHLCKDENPMAKKAALINMGNLANAMGKNKIRDNMIAKLKDVCAEESDLMRLHAVGVCRHMTETFKESKDFSAVLWPIVQKLAEDASWRVRKELAEVIPQFAKVAGPEMASKEIVPIFVGLLRDKEAEVKIAASGKLKEVCYQCKKDVNQVSEVLGELMEDTSQTVRASVSAALGEIAVLCESKVRQAIFDVMKVAVKDEDSLVRCNTLESIQHVAKNVKNPPPSLFTMLQPFASDPKWRVRREYLRASTAFSVASSKTESDTSFDQKLTNNLIECLSDHISSIREEACVQLGEIVGIKGSEWGIKTLLPEALKSVSQSDMGEQSNYITRMTGLVLVTNVSKHLSADQIEKHVVGFVEQCLKDVVENVRFKAARTCEAILPRTSKKVVRERLIPALENVQKGEQDQDILFYSEQALHLARRHCGN